MGKQVFIAEKPSVAREFANALGLDFRSRDGYMEAENTYVTWCVGHLVSMSYPDAYDPSLKRWSLSTIPFIPDSFRYQVIDGVKKQFGIVKKILTDPQVDTIYICTDSGREGEYIYRLVAQEAGVRGKDQKRVWIDSQTKDEILRGIREAKDD
ncbi:MAG: type IA DNA topoisomerase, partial [Lachnospiraceae bacterium]|nr:type IA DNA topoisomerase [Lachnospiraceae bacterium]